MDPTEELLQEIEGAVSRLRDAGPLGSMRWRDEVPKTAGTLARGAAALLDILETSQREALQRTEPEGHRQAKRFAAVRVAEIQLYHAAQVKSGRSTSDLYGALRPVLDAARAAYSEQFIKPVHGVPDYLHQEVVKGLANNDAKLLGPQYPGPLV